MNKKRTRRKGMAALLIALALGLILCTAAVAANWPWDNAVDDGVYQFLDVHSNWLQKSHIFLEGFRLIGGKLVALLYLTAAGTEALLSRSLNLLDFFRDSGISNLADSMIRGLIFTLMTLTVTWLGIKIVVSKNSPNFKSIGVNVAVSILLIVGMPAFMDILSDMALTFNEDVRTADGEERSSLSWTMVKENVADLLYVADQGFHLIENGTSTTEAKNALSPSVFLTAQLNEVLTPKAIDSANIDNPEFEYLRYYLTLDGAGGKMAVEFDSGGPVSAFTDVFAGGYYRYPMNFVTVLLGLFSLAVANLFVLFVYVKTAIELGFKRIVGLFIFATDLETGEKTKLVVQDVMNGFLLIALTGLSFRIYQIFLTYIATTLFNPILYVICLVVATLVLIGGSSTITRYFGIEVGVGKGLSMVLGTVAAAMGLKRLMGGKNLGDDDGASADKDKKGGEKAVPKGGWPKPPPARPASADIPPVPGADGRRIQPDDDAIHTATGRSVDRAPMPSDTDAPPPEPGDALYGDMGADTGAPVDTPLRDRAPLSRAQAPQPDGTAPEDADATRDRDISDTPPGQRGRGGAQTPETDRQGQAETSLPGAEPQADPAGPAGERPDRNRRVLQQPDGPMDQGDLGTGTQRIRTETDAAGATDTPSRTRRVMTEDTPAGTGNGSVQHRHIVTETASGGSPEVETVRRQIHTDIAPGAAPAGADPVRRVVTQESVPESSSRREIREKLHSSAGIDRHQREPERMRKEDGLDVPQSEATETRD